MASQFVKNMAQQTKKKKKQQDAAVDALKSRSGKSVTQVEQSLSNKSIQNAAKKVDGTSASKPTPARQLSKPAKKSDDAWNSSVNGGSSSFVKTMAQNQRAHYEEINRNAAVDAMKQRFRNTQNTHTDYNDSFSNDSAVTQKKATASNAQKNRFTYSPSYIHSQKTMAQDNSTLALSDAQKKNMPKNITVKNQNEPNARVVDQSFKNFNPNDPNYSTPADERSYRNTREGAYAYKHPIAGVASHVINNIGSGFEGIAGTAYQAVTGKKLDDQFFKGTYAAQDAQSGVRRRVQDATGGRQDGISTTGENAAGFLTDTGMSILDSAANRALASYFAPGKAGEVGGLALMAGGAAAGQLTDLNQNEKVSGRRAAVDAAANGAFEYLSEKLSWDKLNAFKDMEVSPHNVGEVIKRIAQQAATEGGEEVFSTLADAAADSLILGNEAEYVSQYNAYKGSGMSNGEAMQNVVYNLLKESALSFLGGAISGGVMGSGATVMNYMNAKANQNFTEDELRQTADAIDTSPEAYTREDGTVDTKGLDQAIATSKKLSGYANKLANGDILTLEEQQDIYNGVESTIDRAADAKGVAPVITEDKNLDEMVNDWVEEATAQEEERASSEPISLSSTPEEAKASTQAAIDAINSPVNVVDETAAEPVTESQASPAEQLATELAQESAQGTNENPPEEYMDAQDMEPDTAMSGQADDIVDVNNIVPEDDAPTLPGIEELSNQYTGNVKTSFENGYEGVDILWYDDNMRKVYQAAVKGETLRDLMQNDTDFQKFFSSPYGDAVLPFYDAAYAEGVKTTGGNGYGDLHNNDEVRDEGAVRQPVEVREGDLGGSDPVRAEEVTDDAAGRQPVSDLEEVGGSDVGSVSGSSGRGVSGQRSTGSSAGDQVSDHVGGRDGGVTPPELVQSAQNGVTSDNDQNITTESTQKTEQNVPNTNSGTEETVGNLTNSTNSTSNSTEPSYNSNNSIKEQNKEKDKKPTKKKAEKKAPKEAVTVEEQTEQKKEIATQEKPKGNNYVLTAESAKSIPSTPATRLSANLDAVKTLKDIMAGDRIATAEEQTILAKYTGWGGIGEDMWKRAETELSGILTDEELKTARSSITDAYYTDPAIINGMYKGLQSIGFNGGKLLEPSAGVGRFIGAMPSDLIPSVRSWTAVELDTVTGNIAKALYPIADVRVQGFEKAILANGYMDAVVGNVPFGEYGVTDKRYPSAITSKIHNYFIARSLDTLRPGGIACLITSSGTMDAKGEAARKYFSGQADLIGAIRLPNTAFKGTGTEVVTDILVFQKRAANTPYQGEAFLGTSWQYNTGDINQYFADHPEMVLGRARRTTGQFGRTVTTYDPLEGKGSLEEQITKAFQHIDRKMEYPKVNHHEEAVKAVKEARNKKQGTAYKKDGKLYKNDGGVETELNLEAKEKAIYEGAVEIRDTARNLVDAMLTGKSDADIAKLRERLNKQYDNFTAKYKNGFHTPAVKKVLRNDTDYAFLQSLEKVKDKTVSKNDIFTRNTVNQAVDITSVNTVSDGIEVSLNQLGYIDSQKIADLMRKPKAEVEKDLDTGDLAFRDADGNFVSATTYLSGNVRAKLKEAEMLAEGNPEYKKNVDALKKVVPAYKHGKDISVNLGVTWIPAELYGDFASELLGGNPGDVTVTYSKVGGYDVKVNRYSLYRTAENTKMFGNKYMGFLYSNNNDRGMLYNILNNRDLTVKSTDLDGKRVPNLEATEACKELKNKITDEFNKWLWKDEGRRTQLEEVYNDSYNAMARAHYDSKVTIPGQTADIQLRDHQGSAINRIVQSPYNTLLQHGAGAGKTFAMIGATKKLRELGIAKKPVIVVPKNKVGDWINDYYKMFPTANVLVADDTTFTAANRKEFTNRIATTDVDAVIISKEQFQKIPMSEEYQKDFIQEQIDSIIAMQEELKANKGGNPSTTRQLESRRKSLQNRLNKLADAKRDTDNITFEETGIDYVFADEAQAYKNLAYTTNLSNVADMGKPDGNQITFDMKMKTDYVRNMQGGKGVVFGTATPVMNSPVEAYAMLQYLCPEELEKRGIYNLDNFIDMFGRIEGITRQDAVGRSWINRNSFTGFINMGEWQQIWGTVTDRVRTQDVPGIKLPKMKGGDRNVVICQAGQKARETINGLADRLKTGDRKGKDHIFALQSDGKKASFSQRMIDPSLPYGANEKVPTAVNEIYKIWNESKTFTDVNGNTQENGVQLVFCDYGVPKTESKSKTTSSVETEAETDESYNPNEEFFDSRVNVYQDMKDMLIEKGVPADQIAFIHDATNDAKRNALYEKIRSGEVRILIGSAKKMGEGLNVQDRVVALHEMNPLARPGDIEQVEARAIRQGNLSPEVAVNVYVTEDTFDTKQWDTLRAKSQFIDEITSGTYSGNNADFSSNEFGASAGDIMAVASGNPLLKEQADNNDKLRKLEGLKKQFDRSIYDARVDLEQTERRIRNTKEMLPKYEADAKKVMDLTGDNFKGMVGKKSFTNREEFGAALIVAAKKAQVARADSTKVGSISGFDIYAGHDGGVIQLVGEASYGSQINLFSSKGTTTMVVNAVKKIPNQLKSAQTSLSVDEANVPKLKAVIGSEFSKADELAATRKRATEIEQELLANNAEAVSDAKESSEGGVYARKLKAAGIKPKAAAGKPVTGKSAVQGFISQTSDARPQDWTAEKNTNSTAEHAKPLAEIIGKAMHDFGINLDTGYVRGAGVTGQYNTNDKGLRTKIANDLPSVSHEFGHWLDDKYNILKDTAIPKAAEEDFQKAFEKEPGNKAAYDPSLHKIEGVAEFIRYYLQNKDTAAIDYPAATEYIKKKITNPTELARFERFADEVNAYYSEGAKSAASALVYKENRISDYRTTKEKAQDAVDKRIQEWVDSNHAIRLLDRKTGGKAYVMASNSAYSEARAKQILEGDLLDINGNYVGHGLKWALQGINTVNKEEYTAFNEYLTVLHGIEWIENGKRVFADDRMNNRQWMASRALELENEYPKFKEAAKRVFEFTDLFTRTYGLGTGLISKDRYLAMKKLYQRYVPFFRAGFKNRGNSLAKAKGSGRQIIMPVDNIMDMVNKMVSTATRNSTLLEIRKASTELGADATLLERIPDPKVPKQINISDLKQEIYESAGDKEMSADALDVLDDVLGTLDDVYTQFELGKANQKKGEICILVDGKPEFWKVNDELLLDSISNMSPGHLGAVLGTYGKITKFMTANITGNNIIWSAFSNAPRDLQTMFNYAKQTKNPAKLFSGIASAYLNSFKEANGKEVSPLYREYLAMGGGNTGVWQGSEKYAADIRKSLNSTGLNKKGNADHFYKHPVSSFFGAISVLSDTIEQGPRFAIYSLCRQQGMTQQEAFHEATDITVNFRRHGTNSKAANAVIPFFNAGIQSTDKTIRYFTGEDLKGTKYTAKQRGKIIFQRWAFLAVTSMIMTAIEYALNHKSKDDKENYNQLSNHVKNSNFLIPLGKGKYFALTKSHELGIPSSAMERILELTQDDQDHAFDDFAAYATSNFLPSIVSDLVEMPFNVASEGLYDASKDALTGAISSTGIFGVGAAINANKDYLGSPIVSSSLEGKVPKQQYTARTSHAAYLMGQFLNLSPQQIDYFGKNVLGGYWTYQTALFPVNDGKGVKGKRDWTLGVKNTYNKDNIYSQDLANWMYDKADESSMYAKSYPDNKTYLLESSQDSAMTSYYSRAMGLVKDNADSAEYRIVKQSLLDSIKTYQKKSDRNAWTSAEKSVQNFVKKTGNKNVLPGALNTEITDSEGKKHSLKGREYIQYQKTYEQAYWKYVKEQFTGKKFSDEDAAQVLSTIKKTAKDVADATILKQKGVKVAKSSSGFNSYKSAASDKLKAKDKDANLSAKDVYNLAVDYAKVNGLDAKTEYYNALSDDQQKKYDEWEKYGGTFDTYDEYLGTRDFKASTYEESGESVSGSKKYKIAKYLVEQVQNNTLSYNQAEVAWELSGYNSKKEKSDTLDDYYGSSEWYKLQNILGY
jgi:N12 class adenine-specific DNA methylase